MNNSNAFLNNYLELNLFNGNDKLKNMLSKHCHKNELLFDGTTIDFYRCTINLMLELKAYCIEIHKMHNNSFNDIELSVEKSKNASGKTVLKLNQVKFKGKIYYDYKHGCFIDIIPKRLTNSVTIDTKKQNSVTYHQSAYLLSVLLFGYTMHYNYRFPVSHIINSPDELCNLIFGFCRDPLIGNDVTIEKLLTDNSHLLAQQYIFGLSSHASESEITVANQNWYKENINFSLPSLNRTAIKIIKESIKYPLFRYLFKKPLDHRTDIQTLLCLTTEIDNGEIVIINPTTALLQFVDKSIKRYMKNTNMSYNEIVLKLGSIADIATLNYETQFIFPIDKDNEFFDSIGLFIKCGYKNYKFKNKHIRLLCMAIRDAQKFNYGKTDYETIKNRLWKFLPSQKGKNKSVMEYVLIADEFDDYLIYASGLFIKIDSSLCMKLIMDLSENEAINFDIQCVSKGLPTNRLKQIAVIYLFTNLLIENIPLSNEMRKCIFLASFGRTLYNFQAEHWYALSLSSKFYHDIIDKTIEGLFNFNKMGKAENQPHYFFLYGYKYYKDGKIFTNKISDYQYYNVHKIFEQSAILHHYSWYYEGNYTNEELILRIVTVMEVIKNAFIYRKTDESVIRKRHKPDVKYKYAISLQLLCYALANIINKNESSLLPAEIQMIKNSKEIIFHAIIYADYYIRKYNAQYGELTDSSNNRKNNVGNHKDLYLLCGASRLCCAIDFLIHKNSNIRKLFISEPTVYLPRNWERDYNKWLLLEKEAGTNQRYMILLLKILSKTSFDPCRRNEFQTTYKKELDTVQCMHDTDTIEKCKFLPYDYMI